MSLDSAGNAVVANSLEDEQDEVPVSDVVPRSDAEEHRSTGPVANYAAFKGAEGRDTYFRPDRYQLSDLGPVGVRVEVRLGDKTFACELQDVSQSGVALEWPRNVPIEIGTILDSIVVKFDEHEAYRGEARIGSSRRDEKKMIVGVSFVDTLMNIEDVLQLRDVKAWTGGAGADGFGLRKAQWRTPGQQQFKALIAELRLFLEDARVRFGELEASLPWHVAHGEHDSPARDALIERIRSEFVSDVVESAIDIDTALRAASNAEREALREYSVRHLHELLMQAPWMYRSRHKPLGYAGDYEIMNGLYGGHFNGPTLFAKALNLAFVSTPAAAAVRARKDLVKHRLSELLDAAPPGRPVRLLSIAAGPAQEVYELLQERESIPCPVEIVLFDQDKRALTFSYGRLQRLANSKWQGRVNIVHLHDSIKRLLRGSSILSGYGAFDAVFSCGLFDYLQPLTWVSLCRSLYASVAPGGTLYIGNMVPSSPCRWFMEMHLDWFLEYRERAALLELARSAAPEAEIAILEETTGVNPFVELKKSVGIGLL